jgi:hypothetical protein
MQNQLQHPCTCGMLLRLTEAERAGACAGAVVSTAPNGAMHIRWHVASKAMCKMRVASSQAMHTPGTPRLLSYVLCQQAVPQSLHLPRRLSAMTAAPLQKTRCYQNGWQGPRRPLNKRQQLMQHSDTRGRAPASTQKGAHTRLTAGLLSAALTLPQTPQGSAARAPVRPRGGTGRPAAACPSRR